MSGNESRDALIKALEQEIEDWRRTACYLSESHPSLASNGIQAETLRWCRRMVEDIISSALDNESITTDGKDAP